MQIPTISGESHWTIYARDKLDSPEASRKKSFVSPSSKLLEEFCPRSWKHSDAELAVNLNPLPVEVERFTRKICSQEVPSFG